VVPLRFEDWPHLIGTMSKHPNNGPTFSKSTIKKSRPTVPVPAKKKAALALEAISAEKTRRSVKLLHREGTAAWLDDLMKAKE
jgi:hypothetical protein